MTETVDFPIFESQAYSLFFELEYTWQPAWGDGWNEPRVPAHWEMQSNKLYSVTKWNELMDKSKPYHPHDNPLVWCERRDDIPEIPQWLVPILDEVDPRDYLDDPRD